MRILITGGAGFVGSGLAHAFRRDGARITALDNLRRRGAELNLGRFREEGIDFRHGDIRQPDDLADLPGNYDLVIEASAEPSVHAGTDGSPAYVIGTNLHGTVNCLEFARKRAAAFLFLSTSRVYSIAALRSIRLEEMPTRFEQDPHQEVAGISAAGIAEVFPVDSARSFYGASKLASELLIHEYSETFGLKALINRCGVIAGPGQFGKTDQGVFTLWAARHYFGLPLRYTGFGGAGKQVRDLLHPQDLFDLLKRQLDSVGQWTAETFNVGGGPTNSVSLQEMTNICRQVLERSVPIGSDPETSKVDVPYYVGDIRRAEAAFAWRPRRNAGQIVADIAAWLRANEKELKPLFSAAN